MNLIRAQPLGHRHPSAGAIGKRYDTPSVNFVRNTAYFVL